MKEITEEYLRPLLKKRVNNSYKGDYGHLLIVAGCQLMPGAAILATTAALQSGCGLVTLHSTQRALDSAAINCPSAMLSFDPGQFVCQMPQDMSKYSAICMGPGLGQDIGTAKVISRILTYCQTAEIPLILDADALNYLAKNPDEMAKISEECILTPHMGELRRLASAAGIGIQCEISHVSRPDSEKKNADENVENQDWKEGANTPSGNNIFDLCKKSNSLIVAKGYRSAIYGQDGEIYQNTTGGPGLAKAGSGDVLAGLTGGLLARGYSALHAAQLGVWLHGKAGDLLSEQRTQESFSSFDLARNLFPAFKFLYSKQ